MSENGGPSEKEPVRTTRETSNGKIGKKITSKLEVIEHVEVEVEVEKWCE